MRDRWLDESFFYQHSSQTLVHHANQAYGSTKECQLGKKLWAKTSLQSSFRKQNSICAEPQLCLRGECCLQVLLQSEGAFALQLFGPLQTDQSSFPLNIAHLILSTEGDPFSFTILVFVRSYQYLTKILGRKLHLCVILVSQGWSQTLFSGSNFSFIS